MELLRRYPWPGNVRELRNMIERILILETGEVIEADDLPPEIITYIGSERKPSFSGEFPSAGLSLEEVEKELIQKALVMADGNQTRAAELLGISRDTLRYRLQKFGLKQ
jgi:DNA-binding NtrC family response regulator